MRIIRGGHSPVIKNKISAQGKSLSSYWTPSNCVVENAEPTHVVLTYSKNPKPAEMIAGNFAVSGNTVNSISGSGKVYTIVLGTALVYGDAPTLTAHGESIAITNNVALDTHAAAFLTAQSNTDETQKKAINQLVIDLKAINSLQANFVNFDTPSLSVVKAMYPFVGGTAAKHKFNLIDPRDADDAYRLTFANITHDSTGIVGSGTLSYADTKMNARVLDKTSYHWGLYSPVNDNTNKYDMGCYAGGEFTSFNVASGFNYDNGHNLNNTLYEVRYDGFHLWNRNACSSLYHNGWKRNFSEVATQRDFPNVNIYLLGMQGYYSTRKISFAVIGGGLTDPNPTTGYTPDVVVAYNHAINRFQRTLGRNTYYSVGPYASSARSNKRLKVTPDGWNTNIYYSIQFPENYDSAKKYPVLFTLPGNYINAPSPLSASGYIDDVRMAKGYAGDLDVLAVCVPFIYSNKQSMLNTWWHEAGVPDSMDITATVDWFNAVLTDLITNHNADATKIIGAGHSRGSIALGKILCSSDALAAKFIGFVAHAHMDGGTFTPTGAEARLARTTGKKWCLVYPTGEIADQATGKGYLDSHSIYNEQYDSGWVHTDLDTLDKSGVTVTAVRTFLQTTFGL